MKRRKPDNRLTTCATRCQPDTGGILRPPEPAPLPYRRVIPYRKPFRRYKRPPGRAHRNRPRRGSVKSYLRRTNPFLFALLYHDHALAQEERQRFIEREAMRNAAIACCIVCHALMIHAGCGVFYCPYDRARVHDRAREVFAGTFPGLGAPAAGAGLTPPVTPAATFDGQSECDRIMGQERTALLYRNLERGR